MEALEYIQEHTIKVYPNEKVYDTYKACLIGSIYYAEMGWYKDTILYKGMTPKDFSKLQGTKEWFELPLFRPDFSRYKEL
jgi:hypothetical protein